MLCAAFHAGNSRRSPIGKSLTDQYSQSQFTDTDMDYHKCPFHSCPYATTSFYGLRRHMGTCKHKRSNRPRAANQSSRPVQNSPHLPFPPPAHVVPNISVEDTFPECAVSPDDEGEALPTLPQQHNEQHSFNAVSSLGDQVRKAHKHVLAMANTVGYKDLNSFLQLITNPAFPMEEFRMHASSLSQLKTHYQDSFNNTIENDGFRKIQLSPNTSGDANYFYMKDVVAVLQRQLAVASGHDIFLRPVTGTNGEFRHPMETRYFRDLHDRTKYETMTSSNRSIFWKEDSRSGSVSFVGLVQLYTDKTAMTRKTNAMVAYPIHAVLLNFQKDFRRILIDNGHTLVGFLPCHSEMEVFDNWEMEAVRTSTAQSGSTDDMIPLNDYIGHTSDTGGRMWKMHHIHEAMKTLLADIVKQCDSGFPAALKTGTGLICIPRLVSYCCDIPEGKDMSSVLHGVTTKHPCVRCMVTGDGIVSMTTASPRRFEYAHDCRVATESDEQQELAAKYSLSCTPSFLEGIAKHSNFIPGEIYNLFTFESLHNFHLGISKQLKRCLMDYVACSDNVNMKFGDRRRQKRLGSQRVPILKALNGILATIERKYFAPGLHVDFSKKEKSSTLNGLFGNDGLRGMLEGKNYRSVDLVFPFLMGFLDRVLGFQETPTLTKMHTTYTDLMVHCLHDAQTTGWTAKSILTVAENITSMKKMIVSQYGPHSTTGLYTLKFHLLDHLPEDISRFGSLSMLDASPYEHFNTVIKNAYRQTSQRLVTRMDEMINVLEKRTVVVVPANVGHIRAGRKRRLSTSHCYLVREGTTMTTRELALLGVCMGQITTSVMDCCVHCATGTLLY